MPPTFGAAQRCPRCNDRVYAAEQVIGPMSKMYHRHCLKCVVCNRRLDSVSLLEHDGEPFCSNCHRTHLGQGKDRFGTAVPLKPKIPILTSQNPPTTSHCKPSQPPPSKANSDTNISARKPLPISPSGSQDPLPIPASLSMQNVVPLHGPPAVGQTPLCGRCQTPVCMYDCICTYALTLRLCRAKACGESEMASCMSAM